MTATIARGPIKPGRPRAKANADKPNFWETELYALVYEKLPKFVVVDGGGTGRLNLLAISEATKFHRFTVNKWFTNNKLSPKAAAALIKESGGTLSAEDLATFLIN